MLLKRFFLTNDNYKKGDLVVVEKRGFSRTGGYTDVIEQGDEIFAIRVDAYGNAYVEIGVVGKIYEDEQAIAFENKLNIYLIYIKLIKCIFIFIIAFITDTYAYIGGCLIGRHKLTSISPKKTIEGSVIGTIMGTLIGSVYYYNLVNGVTIFETVVLCLFLTLLSEFGDLFFSSIKRYFDKKDYSNLIPGHGGVLDRFDSVIYVSLGLSLILSIM